MYKANLVQYLLESYLYNQQVIKSKVKACNMLHSLDVGYRDNYDLQDDPAFSILFASCKYCNNEFHNSNSITNCYTHNML